MARPKKVTFTETELDFILTGVALNAVNMSVDALVNSGAEPSPEIGGVIMGLAKSKQSLLKSFSELRDEFLKTTAAEDEDRNKLIQAKMNGTVRG